MEGRFIMVHASYPSHLGEDCLFVPEAKLNDGIIWLVIIKADATRSQVFHFLLGLSDGTHMNTDCGDAIQMLPTRAFRIEPDMHEKGYMTVDGEHVEYGPIQGEIFPGLASVLVPWYEESLQNVSKKLSNLVLSSMEPVLINFHDILNQHSRQLLQSN